MNSPLVEVYKKVLIFSLSVPHVCACVCLVHEYSTVEATYTVT